MPEYRINNIKPLPESSILASGIYIVVLYVGSIPPHLGLLVENHYFSLSVHGLSHYNSASSLLKLIETKKIPSLLFRLQNPTNKAKPEAAKKIFSIHPVVNEKVSCLTPLKDFCSFYYGTSQLDIKYIFNLLPLLEAKSLINDRFQINLDNEISKGFYGLKKYTTEDIQRRINDLKKGATIC